MEPTRASVADNERQSYRSIDHWKDILDGIFKDSIGDTERAEKATELVQLFRDESAFNFINLSIQAFGDGGLKTKGSL
jgi:hypothetical protein